MAEPVGKVTLNKAQRFGRSKQRNRPSDPGNLKSLRAELNQHAANAKDVQRLKTDPLNLSGSTPVVSAGASPSQNESEDRAAEKEREEAQSDEVDVVIPKNPRDPLCLDSKKRKRRRHHYPSHASAKRHKLEAQRSADDSGKSDAQVQADASLDQMPDGEGDNRDSSSGVASSCGVSNTPQETSKDSDVFVSAGSGGDSDSQSVASNAGSILQKEHEDDPGGRDSRSHNARHDPLRFRYGNFTQYYGYRNAGAEVASDGRLKCMDKAWFTGRDVLDIGCNSGLLTNYIAKEFNPRSVLGVDIDGILIGIARKNLLRWANHGAYPSSFPETYGPLGPSSFHGPFPNNVAYMCANYVLSTDAQLQLCKEQYDVILMLSLTKWLHLNYGDDGLKRAFRRAFAELRPGGVLLLEPQAYATYKKRTKSAPELYANYASICFFPNDFLGYLQNTVGFVNVKSLGSVENRSRGFQRPLYALFKPEAPYSDERHVEELLRDVVRRVVERTRKYDRKMQRG